MSRTILLKALKRDNQGSAESRRLRHTGRIPAVIYGGDGDNENITLRHDDVFHALEKGGFFSTIIDLEIEGAEAQEVFAKDVQKHPYKPFLIHADFQRIKRGQEMTIDIPLHAINAESCVGVKAGGILSHMVNTVSVTCRPRSIPEYLEVDVEHLEVNESVHLSQIALPEDVKLTDLELGHDDFAVMAVLPPKVQVEEEEVEEVDAGDVPTQADEEAEAESEEE